MLEGEELTEKTVEKEFGNEKNKLVIQPTGILVMEFLIKHFDSFFCYHYTKHMEDQLDSISRGENIYPQVCLETWNELTKLIEPLKEEKKCEIRIDESHSYIIGKHGPVIKKVIDNQISFLPVKKDIDMQRLESGGYVLEDLLVELKTDAEPIGRYEGIDLYVKKGKYGTYAQWGENRKALTELGNKNITYLDVIKILEKDKSLDPSKPVGFIREVSKNISIRKGQYGDYILYKTSKMKKPQFFKLNGFKHDYKKCPIHELQSWLKDTHKIE